MSQPPESPSVPPYDDGRMLSGIERTSFTTDAFDRIDPGEMLKSWDGRVSWSTAFSRYNRTDWSTLVAEALADTELKIDMTKFVHDTDNPPGRIYTRTRHHEQTLIGVTVRMEGKADRYFKFNEPVDATKRITMSFTEDNKIVFYTNGGELGATEQGTHDVSPELEELTKYMQPMNPETSEDL